MQKFKVGSKSDPAKVAGALSSVISADPTEKVRLECIGASAVNNAVKAVAIARSFVISSGIDLMMQPNFQPVYIEGEEKTGVALTVEVKPE